MKVYQTNEIKNISLLGSSGSGKTTLVEAMLFESGVIKRRGSVAAKNTVSDYFPVEQEYGYSVFSTVFHVEWNNKKLNMIDCPGADDFVGGAVTALNVTDTAILLINGQYGVEVGTQNHFRYTEKFNKPVIFLVNQLDNEKCDYDNILEQLKEAYGNKVIPVQYPIATGPNFNALIDVLLMKKYSWKPEGGAPIIEDIPAEEMDKAMEMHKALVEAAAENEEELMEKFFEQESLSEDEMREGIRMGLANRGIFPVFCVCAGKDMGVRRLMEFLGNVVPFVSDMPKVVNTEGKEVAPDSNGPSSLYFFKTSVEPGTTKTMPVQFKQINTPGYYTKTIYYKTPLGIQSFDQQVFEVKQDQPKEQAMLVVEGKETIGIQFIDTEYLFDKRKGLVSIQVNDEEILKQAPKPIFY